MGRQSFPKQDGPRSEFNKEKNDEDEITRRKYKS